MFAQVTIRVADLATATAFYDLVLAEIGVRRTAEEDGLVRYDNFALAQARPDAPASRNLHVGFVAGSHAAIDAFWRAGTAAGYADDGAPGPRRQYRDDYYGAFLRDPGGNSAEAMHDGALADRGVIDHLWIRVRSLPAARAFYTGLAPAGGLRVGADTPERLQLVMDHGTFSLVASERPTEHVDLAFTAAPGEQGVRVTVGANGVSSP